jgi:hypothetical protein
MALVLPHLNHIAAKDRRVADALRKLVDAVNPLATGAKVKVSR